MRIAIVGRLLDDRHDALVAAITAQAAEHQALEVTSFDQLADPDLVNHATSYGLIVVGETPETPEDGLDTARLLDTYNLLGAVIIVRDVEDERERLFDGTFLYVQGEDFEQVLIEVEAIIDDNNHPTSGVSYQISASPLNDGF